MGDRVAKDALFDGFAEVAKAFANGHRAELVDVLAQGERHVEELAGEIDQSVANTSFHLRTLAESGLVSTRRDGTRVYYRLASEEVAELWGLIRTVAESHLDRLDELAGEYLRDRRGLDQMSRDDLARRLELGDVFVIDVRPAAEYAAGHITGARSVPIRDLASEVRSLPDEVEIVAYCRGPYCVFADDAVRMLASEGRTGRRLEGGFPEWRRDGRPVSTGNDDE
jgi:rhodanese-related sulfurtransferase/predicted transcriptional regulator